MKGPGISIIEVTHDVKYRLRWRDEQGNQRSKTYGSVENPMTLAEINQLRDAELVRNGRISRKEYLFDDLVEPYIRFVSRQRISDQKSRLMTQLLTEFGGKELSRIGTIEVEEWQSKLLQSGLAPATVNKKIACLKHMFSKAFRWKMCSRETLSCVRDAEMLKVQNQRLRYLTQQEIDRLLDNLQHRSRSSEMYVQVQIALNTGMRRGEIFGLTWDRVDMVNRIILLDKTKSSKRREIPINNTLYEVLSGIKVRNINGRLFTFTGDSAFANAVERCNIHDFHFHDLRHTFASRMMQAGCDLATLQKLLGHASLNMTMRYAHLAPGATTDAVRLLDRVPQCSISQVSNL